MEMDVSTIGLDIHRSIHLMLYNLRAISIILAPQRDYRGSKNAGNQ